MISDLVIIRVENRLRRNQGQNLSFQFQRRHSKGILILGLLERVLRSKKFDDVARLFQSIGILVKDLQGKELESFQRLTELLFKKALTFKVKAEKKIRIAELSLTLTRIILEHGQRDSGGRKNHRAIIKDKLYKAGDDVTDKRGELVRGLRLVEFENEAELLFGSPRFCQSSSSTLRVVKCN